MKKITFKPRGPVALVGPLPATDTTPKQPNAKVFRLDPPQAFGLGLGGFAYFAKQTNTEMPTYPYPRPVKVSPIIFPTEVINGRVVKPRLDVPAVNTTPRVNRSTVSRRDDKPYEGAFFTIHGNPSNTGLNIPHLSVPVVGRIESPIFQGSSTFISHQIPPDYVRKPVIGRVEFTPPPGSWIFASGDTETVAKYSIPFVSRQEYQPYPGSSVSSQSSWFGRPEFPTTKPPFIGRLETKPFEGSSSSTKGRIPDGALANKPLVVRLESKPFEGTFVISAGDPPPATTTVPRRAIVGSRLDLPEWSIIPGGWVFHSGWPTFLEPPLVIDTFDIDATVIDTFNIGDGGDPALPEKLFVGDVRRFQAKDFTRDDSPWVITSATLYLVNPSGVVTAYSANQLSSTIWYYDTASNELNVKGIWRRYWRLSDGSVTLTYQDYDFVVRDVT